MLSVIADPGLQPPSIAKTAVVLCSHLNFATGQLNPSAARLAMLTAQTERTIFKHLAKLEERGYVARVGSKGRVTNRYNLLIPTMNTEAWLMIEAMTRCAANHEQTDTVVAAPMMNGETGLEATTMNSRTANHERRSLQPGTDVHTNLKNLESNLRRSASVEVSGKSWLGAKSGLGDAASASNGDASVLDATAITLSAEDRARLIQAGLSDAEIRNWFGKANIEVVARELRVTVPTPFFRNWVANHYGTKLERAWRRDHGELTVVVVVAAVAEKAA